MNAHDDTPIPGVADEYQSRLDAERVTLEFYESPLFGGPAQMDLFYAALLANRKAAFRELDNDATR